MKKINTRQPKFIHMDLTGQRFGRLYVQGFYYNDKGNYKWYCLCDCGKLTIVTTSRLRDGKTKSCGCYKREYIESCKTHGLVNTSEYRTWSGMKSRCLNPKAKSYKNYGGRGITVCERWLKFENFFADMGKKPSKEYSLERIDNNKGYYVDNCKWASKEEQSRNKRNNIIYILNGEPFIMQDLIYKFNKGREWIIKNIIKPMNCNLSDKEFIELFQTEQHRPTQEEIDYVTTIL